MNPDPLDTIEERQAHHDLGIIAVRIYQGARTEGSKHEAIQTTTAWFLALIKHNTPTN